MKLTNKPKVRNTYSWCPTERRYTLDVPVEKVEAKPTKKKVSKKDTK